MTNTTINGTAVDGDGQLESVSAVYEYDGNTYTANMADNGDGTFTATKKIMLLK